MLAAACSRVQTLCKLYATSYPLEAGAALSQNQGVTIWGISEAKEFTGNLRGTGGSAMKNSICGFLGVLSGTCLALLHLGGLFPSILEKFSLIAINKAGFSPSPTWVSAKAALIGVAR